MGFWDKTEESEIKAILAKLPIWKIHSEKLIYKRSHGDNIYLLPEGIPYFPTTKASVHFVDLEDVDRTTAKLFDIPERSLIDYIKKDILPGANMRMADDLKKKYT